MTDKNNDISNEYLTESAVATFITSPNHEVLFWNKACEELTGICSSQVMLTDDHWTAFYDTKRPCLADIVINGKLEELPNLYAKYGQSKLSPNGISAEGWYEKLGGKRRYIIFDAVPIYNESGELLAAIETLQDITEIKNDEEEKIDLINRLKSDFVNRESLKGFIPICSSCKNIRNSDGEWITLEKYFDDKMDIRFNHGICPKCAQKLYPEFYNQIKE